MAKAVQTEMFPRENARSLYEAVKARLGVKSIVRPVAVASACNVSIGTVYAWIDDGRIEAANVGGDRAYWQVFAPSVLKFYRERLGIEEEVVATAAERSARCGAGGAR